MSAVVAEAVDLLQKADEYKVKIILDMLKYENNDDSAFGMLNKYANTNKISEEKSAFENAMVDKYANIG